MPRQDEFRSPIPPPDDDRRPTPAPAYVALLGAWCGLLVLSASVVYLFLPGSQDPRAELEGLSRFGLADRFVPFPVYGSVVAMFMGIVVLWQMRREPRPLPGPLAMQRVQAWTAIALGVLAATVVYVDVAVRGPR
jgi:hypothetical protein